MWRLAFVSFQGIAPDLQARTVVGVFDRVEDADISLVMQQRGAAPERGAGETTASEGTVAGASS